MNGSYQAINNGQLGLAALLMSVNVGLSLLLRLGLARSQIIASGRMVLQLLLIGYVLEWLFAQNHPGLIAAIALAMTVIAGISAVGRTKRKFIGIYWNSILSILVAAALVSQISLLGIIQIRPWYDPQYLIPILGMILGNILNGISLGMDRFIEGLVTQQSQIEMLLAHGATRWEASHRQIQDAVRTGMIPITNSMMVMGVVSLPGMMTGQILAGANPIDAVRYQIVIVFMIAAATALGTLLVVLLAFRQLLSPNHRLRLDRVPD
ncbi:ABC transporter permease [Lyngbya confervoides]|uniref:Iron export ABC transporter permease subunit FetB n=1 Tax=Lyngbya confervoides BDU141951 TaxID=1574623 RepID=A0ABD4T9N1_9CYAN|nr:iron export ABC transporter permease subunit FetB [Lyngbya confervoides]MCM1985155.1 iron export ABC transporter permease subunit FetB [Lyngbya confervoides BDU141951]